MTAVLRAQWRALHRTFGSCRRRPLGTLAAIVVVGASLAVPIGLAWLIASVHAGLSQTGREAVGELSVFLNPEASREDARRLVASLARDSEIRKVRLISKEDSARRLAADQDFAALLAALPENPLPDTLVVLPRDPSPARSAALAARLGRMNGVAQVRHEGDWQNRLETLLARLAEAGWALSAALALGVGLIVGNTVRLELMHQRDEVAVLCRLGATNAYIRRPYLWFGALVGVAGGLLAAALLFAARTALRTPWQDIVAGVMLTPHALAETNAWLVALPALLGALLGWLGAAVAAGLHLARAER
ncbi:MAG: hypothetical protein AMXMBFR6_11580 [Betaproteobacteria bacterium]